MKEEKIQDWPSVKQRLKEKYPELTEDDLIYEAGKEIELLERLQKKLKKNQMEIRKWLSLMG
jgi:hypothetical protein